VGLGFNVIKVLEGVIVGVKVSEVLLHPVGVLTAEGGTVGKGLALLVILSVTVLVGLIERDRDIVRVGETVLDGEIVLHTDIVIVTLAVRVILPTTLVDRVIVCEKEFVGETVGVPP